MLRAKIAVEAAGVLDDGKASDVIAKTLLTHNYWIMETAVRASRNIHTTEALRLITKYIWQMTEYQTIRGRRDLVDLFRLNQSFARIPFIITGHSGHAATPTRLATVARVAANGDTLASLTGSRSFAASTARRKTNRIDLQKPGARTPSPKTTHVVAHLTEQEPGELDAVRFRRATFRISERNILKIMMRAEYRFLSDHSGVVSNIFALENDCKKPSNFLLDSVLSRPKQGRGRPNGYRGVLLCPAHLL
jgi:hypothetical protein